MILKSFYRKKTTLIYLLIFVLIFSALGTVIIGKDYYIKQANKNYQESFIYISSPEYINFDDMKNIKSYDESIKNGIFYYKSYHKPINDNEVIFPSFLKNSYKINDQIEYKGSNNNYTFTIVGYYDNEYLSPILYVNENTLDILLQEDESYSYMLKLEDWFMQSETASYIRNTYDIEPLSFEIELSNIDFTGIIRNFTIFTYVIIGLFIIVLIFTIRNIIHDEKEKNYIYHALGYSKKRIFYLQFINVTSLFVISLSISLIIIFIIKNIFGI